MSEREHRMRWKSRKN